eukprot:868216-Prymnesium_polylepis.2
MVREVCFELHRLLERAVFRQPQCPTDDKIGDPQLSIPENVKPRGEHPVRALSGVEHQAKASHEAQMLRLHLVEKLPDLAIPGVHVDADGQPHTLAWLQHARSEGKVREFGDGRGVLWSSRHARAAPSAYPAM